MTKTQRLVKIYTDSLQRLIAEVRKRIDQGAGTISQDMMIVAIDQEFRRLNVETAAWAQEAIKEAYERGAMDAWRAVAAGDANVRPFAAFGGLNRPAAELLAHNTKDFLRIANDLIARQARDVIRRVGVEVTGKKFAEMLTVRETKKLMETRLAEEGFGTQVPWRNGRGSMRTDSYAELVARTTTAEATNTGTINQMNAMGQHLVKMTAHNTTCKVCASRQGRVYRTIEFPEGDPRQQFPHIREGMPRWPTYKTIHPNCAHRLLPYIWSQKTEKEQKEALSRAGEPFNHDPRGEAERMRYEKAQRERAERLRDRKQWERYKAVLGDDAPKTLSGFRSMKRAGSERWIELKETFRQSGGVSGAKKTPGWEDRHAERFYESIRKRAPGADASRISAHTPFKQSAIEEIRHHMFIKEHMLDGKMQRFAPDYEQSQAWQRLTDGKGTETDLVLLKHEYVELTQMRLKRYTYEEAHAIANRRFNWQSLVDGE